MKRKPALAISEAPQRPPHRAKSRLRITISNSPDDLAVTIRRAARRALESRNIRRGELDIALVGAAEMRRQHARWLRKKTLTDVLTFDLREKPEIDRVEGQLIVCISVARQRARSRKSDWQRELLLYVVHGCLHLCGYDDHNPADAMHMHEQEDKILIDLGWGAVFSPPRRERTLSRSQPKKERRKKQ